MKQNTDSGTASGSPTLPNLSQNFGSGSITGGVLTSHSIAGLQNETTRKDPVKTTEVKTTEVKKTFKTAEATKRDSITSSVDGGELTILQPKPPSMPHEHHDHSHLNNSVVHKNNLTIPRIATMSTTSLNDLSPDTLSCSECSQWYQTPVLLPCLHTFCRRCIDIENNANQERASSTYLGAGFCVSTASTTAGVKNAQCPICKIKYPVSELKTDHFIVSITIKIR